MSGQAVLSRAAGRDAASGKKPDAAPEPSEEKPAKFTAGALRARGFKVPEPRGDGFIIGMGGPIRRKP
jgi:hypothetical protein